MRITHEADYAIRIIYYLSLKGCVASAKEISESNGITQRFTLKILRKLILTQIVTSYKGAYGGYKLFVSPRDISLGQVIEIVDGPIAINHCLTGEFDCTRIKDKRHCDFHKIFNRLNLQIRDRLYNINFSEFLPKNDKIQGEKSMKKFVCTVCGYVHEGESAPAFCPVCKVSSDKFKEQGEGMAWAAEHALGVAQGASQEILDGLKANFEGECSEVGMYLAMARVAHREGYPEIGLYWEKAAWEEAEHASKFAELLGECLTNSTKKNLEMRVAAENGATAGKFELAKLAKAANLDAIHDTVHEMARDEARHGKAFEGLLNRYFK